MIDKRERIIELLDMFRNKAAVPEMMTCKQREDVQDMIMQEWIDKHCQKLDKKVA